MEKMYLFFWLDVGKFIITTYQNLDDVEGNIQFLKVESINFMTQKKNVMYINLEKVMYITVISEEDANSLFTNKKESTERIN